ncbi:MAG: 4Fe-4S binding protein [Spirochaetia bacterium]|jgi:polyferredoxin
MKKRTLVWLKRLRVVSQAVFLAILVYTFIRSLDPFSVVQNPFLRFDPLIFLTNPRPDFYLIAPIAGLIALTLVLGRFFCGWICPMGSLIELSDNIFSFPRKANPAAIHASPQSFLVRLPPALVVLGAVVVSVFTSTSLLPYFHPNVWIVRILSRSVLGLVFLGLVLLSSLFGRRLWCVFICPLGALYGVFSRISFLRLRIEKCSQCKACDRCPMQAADFRTREILPYQCILCFDYEKSCPVEGFRYGLVARAGKSTLRAACGASGSFDPSRREFLLRGAGLLGGAMVGGVLAGLHVLSAPGALKPDRLRSLPGSTAVATTLCRPPGVIDEASFLRRCVRCLHCIQSCPNGIIEVTGLEAGFTSLFTPHLRFDKNGCDYRCQVCQLVCPNQAIPLQTLAQKQLTPIGLAFIDQKKCVVYNDKKPCLVCQEVCPIPEKAISFAKEERMMRASGPFVLRYPSVVTERCIGCGICQAACPAEKVAITVSRKA